MRYIVIVVSVVILIGGFACRDQGVEPPIDTNKIKLTLIDTSVREVYIHIHVANTSNSETVTILRNGVVAKSFSSVINDTMFADTGLTANTLYTYQALIQVNSRTFVKSNPISTQTLLPTSHNFTWQTFVLGGGDDSWLRDVTVIDDSTIYAVGEVSVRDSSGQVDPNPYNTVKCNGMSSQLLRVPTEMYGGFIDTFELLTVFGFSESNVWTFSIAGSYSHWNGNQWQTNYVAERSGGGVKLWGSSSSNLYLVGTNGSISRYNGSMWQKLESGTTTAINDIWGVTNPVNQKEEVYCAVSDIFQFKDRKILKLVNGQVDSVSWNAQRDAVLSLWTNRGFPMYVSGGLGLYDNKTNTWQKVDFGGTNVYPSSIRGTGLNNIVVVGSFGFVAHYNGVDWKILTDVYDAAYSAVAVKDNTIATVGSKNGKAILTIGKQNC